jgi:hypothetical protein
VEHKCEEDVEGIPCYMGIDSDPRLRGDFYLQTNYEEPFDRGVDGTTYQEYETA